MTEPRRERRHWVALFAVFVANGVSFGVWGGNIPRLRAAAGLDDMALGIVLLSLSLGAGAAMQVAGRLAGRVGTARACWLFALWLGGAMALPALALHGLWLLAAAFVLGFGMGGLDVCMNAHAAEVERRWARPIMSSFHAGWSLGQLAGAAMAGVLAGLGAGLEAGLALPGLVVAALGLAAVSLPEMPAPPRGERTRFGWPGRALLPLCAVAALSFAIEGGVADWSGVYLRTRLGAPDALAPTALAALAATMVACRLAGDRLVARLGPARVLVYGAVLAASGLVLAVAAPGLVVAACGFALVGAGVANIVPVAFSAAGRRGTSGVAIVATAGYAAVLVAPPLLGLVAQHAGLRTAFLLLASGAGAVALVGRRSRDQL